MYTMEEVRNHLRGHFGIDCSEAMAARIMDDPEMSREVYESIDSAKRDAHLTRRMFRGYDHSDGYFGNSCSGFSLDDLQNRRDAGARGDPNPVRAHIIRFMARMNKQKATEGSE